MKQKHTRRRLMIAGAVATAAFAVAGSAVWSQTATTSTTSTSTSTSTSSAGVLTTSTATATKSPPTSSTAQMVQEACQRSKARAAKFQANGTPEQWGSEEPFTFDPKTPCG